MRDFQSLQLYLPAVVAKAVAESKRQPNGTSKPEASTLQTVCLFADVAGFTSLTEKLCELGPNGLEDLSTNLNKFVTQLVKLTTRAGGDVLKFAGDAMLALWPEVDPNDPRDYELRVQRAVQCAVDIQEQLKGFKFSVYAKDSEYEDIVTVPSNPKKESGGIASGELEAKLGLGIGLLHIMYLGGNADQIQRERFEYVALGPALMEAIESEKMAKKGEVVVSRAIWDMVGEHFVPFAPVKSNAKTVTVRSFKASDRVPWRTFDRTVPSNNETERKLWKYVPNAVMPYLVQTNDEFWAPELRIVSTLFVDLGLDAEELGTGQNSQKLEQVFYEIQGILLGYEGTINKCLFDDKGSTLIAVFGLPPIAHEDDPLRGILSALKILWMLGKYRLKGSVGISTGLAFCGIIGHAAGNRREYSVIGDTVNLAARLMGTAKTLSSNFLMDRSTKTGAENTVFEFIPITIAVKGKREPVQCYQIAAIGTSSDPHSMHQSHLTSISKKNGRILNSQSPKYRQKTRRRGTKLVVSNPNDMKRIEERQVQAMNSVGFLGRRADARRGRTPVASTSSESSGAAVAESHDLKLVAATSSFLANGSRKSASRKSASRRSASREASKLVVFTFFPRAVTQSGRHGPSVDEQKTSVTASLEESVRNVHDMLKVVLAKAVSKGLVTKEAGEDYSLFELVWMRGAERVTLRPSQLLNTIAHDWSLGRINLLLVQYSTPRGYAPDAADQADQELRSAAYVRDCLARAYDEVASGKGGKTVLLDGDHGVGKSRLVESFLLSETESLDEEVLLGYGRGNPFEAGRNARPFAIWEHLINSLLSISPESDLETQGSTPESSASKEEQLREAVAAAAPLAAASAHGARADRNLSVDDLYKLNKILMTQFEEPSDGLGGADAAPPQPPGPDVAKKATKKTRKIAKSKNVVGASADGLRSATPATSLGQTPAAGSKVSRVKNLTSMFGVSSENLFDGMPRGSRRISRLGRLSSRARNSAVPGGARAGGPSAAVISASRASVGSVRVADPASNRLSCDPETRTLIRLLAGIVAGLAARAPVVLVVDESHYMDTFSWLVFQELAENWTRSSILIILLHRLIRIERRVIDNVGGAASGGSNRVSVFRPAHKSTSLLKSQLKGGVSQFDDVETSILVHEAMKASSVVTYLELHPSTADTKDIICNFANVDRVPDELVAFLRRKTKGNPLYVSDAVRTFLDAGLIAKRTSPGPELFFPSNEFEERRKRHDLPIPLSMESMVGSIIDKMSLTQQLIIKVAAIIGEVFTLRTIKAIFPLAIPTESVDTDFDELVKSNFIIKCKSHGSELRKRPADRVEYTFESGWMVEVLRKRMTNKQKLKLNKRKNEEIAKQDAETMNEYLSRAGEALMLNHSGHLFVKKENSRNPQKPWKPRWCTLDIRASEIVQTYEEGNEKRLEVVKLNSKSQIRKEPAGTLSIESVHQVSDTLFCFTIYTTAWEKKGRSRADPREFTFATFSDELRMQWIYRVQYKIDELQGKHGEADTSHAHEPGPSQRTASASTAPGSDLREPANSRGRYGSNGSGHAAGHANHFRPSISARPSVSTVASNESSGSHAKKGILKSVFSKRRKSVNRVQFGVSLQQMSADDFQAIRAQSSLNVFWAQGKPDPNATPHWIPEHTRKLWDDTCEFAIVSRNSDGEIDGYLCGKLQNGGPRPCSIGLVAACAVLPQARRQGIGRRLYGKFFALARGRECQFVRVMIPRGYAIPVEFHRALGFEEDSFARPGVDLICFSKSLGGAGEGQEEEFLECSNPMFTDQRRQGRGPAALPS